MGYTLFVNKLEKKKYYKLKIILFLFLFGSFNFFSYLCITKQITR